MPTPTPAVLTGVDVLLRDGLETLSAKRVGLITNATGRTSDGRSTIDALHADSRWSLAALFSPEHGIRGEAQAGQSIDSRTDPATGLPIHSLYGTTTRPTAQMLQGLDALVYDVQDVGARTYTYISTLLEVMRAASQHSLPVVVLDRPNPIGGDHVDGNVLDTRFASFVGPAPIAMRYGMTLGELAQRFNADVGADLHVVRLVGWQRSMWFDQTDLEWVNPSPNIRSLSAAALSIRAWCCSRAPTSRRVAARRYRSSGSAHPGSMLTRSWPWTYLAFASRLWITRQTPVLTSTRARSATASASRRTTARRCSRWTWQSVSSQGCAERGCSSTPPHSTPWRAQTTCAKPYKQTPESTTSSPPGSHTWPISKPAAASTSCTDHLVPPRVMPLTECCPTE